jgi:triosephosphate isomerase
LLSAFFDVTLTALKGLPMKKVYLNLKRFDIPVSYGGINNIASGEHWSKRIVFEIEKLKGCEFTIFFPESSLISALQMASSVKIGCQGIHSEDVRSGGNFGAFTSFRTAKSMKALGVNDVLIAHSEDRKNLEHLLSLGGGSYDSNLIYNEQIGRAEEAGLDVLYCIGEKEDEQIRKYDVIKHQLEVGLKGRDLSRVTIAYEPVWAIGPGKVPPDEAYIRDIVRYIKSIVNVPVVYGGGLKKENAVMLAGIPELDGGLIALTRFGSDFGFNLQDFQTIVATYEKGLNA